MTDLIKAMAKEHPVMLVFVLALVGSSMLYSLQVFADKEEVSKKFAGLEARITTVENKVDLRHLETQLYSLDAEIYQLERLVSDGQANERDHTRLATQRTLRTTVTNKIENIPQPQ